MKEAEKLLQSPRSRRLEHEVEAGVAGAIAGAAAGAVAGPPGAIAGAVIGGAVGVLVGATLENQSLDTNAHEAQLDDEIGVNGGDLGAPNLLHPPSKRNAPSAASCGVGGGGGSGTSAEGPMQAPDD